MTTIRLYQKHSQDFQKATIEIHDIEILHLIKDSLIHKLDKIEETIEFVKNDNVRKTYQKKFDKIIGMLDQFSKPVIIRNEKNELIQKMKQMEMVEVYRTLDDYTPSI